MWEADGVSSFESVKKGIQALVVRVIVLTFVLEGAERSLAQGQQGRESGSERSSVEAIYRRPVTYVRSLCQNLYGEFKPVDPEEAPEIPPEKKESGVWVRGDSFIGMTGSGWSGNDEEWIPLDRIGIFLESDDPRLHLVALHLVKHLDRLPHYREITVYPPETRPADGALAPDLHVRVRLEEVPEGEKGETKFLLRYLGGSGFVGGFHPRYLDGRPPTPSWEFDGEVEASSFRVGIGRDQGGFDRLADKFGEKIFESIRDQVRKRRLESAVLPDLPDAFYPEAKPAPRFAFLEERGATRLLSQRTLLRPNVTWWTFRGEGPPEELLGEISSALQEEGWEEDRLFFSSDEDGIRYANLKHPERRAAIKVGTNWHDEADWFFGKDREGPPVYFVVYQEIASEADREAMVDALLASDPTPSQLAIVPAVIDRGEEPEWLEPLLSAAPSFSPAELCRASYLLHVDFREEEAARDLHTLASIKSLWREMPDDVLEDLEDLAGRLESDDHEIEEDPILLALSLSPQQRERFGVREADAVDIGEELSRKIGEPFLVRLEENAWAGLIVYRSRPFVDDEGDGAPPEPFLLRAFHLHREPARGENDYTPSRGKGHRSHGIGPGGSREVELIEWDARRLEVTVGSDGEEYRIRIEGP